MAAKLQGAAQLAAVSAVVFGVSLGLCGATYLISMRPGVGSDGLMPLGMLEMLGIGAGFLGLVVSLVWVVVAALATALSGKDKQ